MKPLRIGIVGERRSGKDVCGDFFASYGCTKIAIAAPMKRGLDRSLDALLAYAATHSEYAPIAPLLERLKNNKGARRRMMQEDGFGMREEDQDILVRSLFGRYSLNDEMRDGQFVVMDVRYENESEWLKRAGFTILRLTAPEEVRRSRAEAIGDGEWIESDGEHPSETEMRKIHHDFLVENDGTLEQLYAKLSGVIAAINTQDDEYAHV